MVRFLTLSTSIQTATLAREVATSEAIQAQLVISNGREHLIPRQRLEMWACACKLDGCLTGTAYMWWMAHYRLWRRMQPICLIELGIISWGDSHIVGTSWLPMYTFRRLEKL